ncbi:hypothetical protein BC360_26450 [Ensifer sp. LC163]|nr:hypothetical protein BC360_26450 [Ensifer sp. LC163]
MSAKAYQAIAPDEIDQKIMAKKMGLRRPRPMKCEGHKTSRGEQLLRRHWEEKPPCASAVSVMIVF